ncbi:heterokaryon incompatibility protein-domain-containing protein [Xylariaceae sp. FL0016]|nr:heterokaryon incompatibility protein-domain-containing protein [Xylariaceae sp. FL0016]
MMHSYSWAHRLKSKLFDTALGDWVATAGSPVHEISSEEPAYPYRGLSSPDIRLVRILPGDGQIACCLEHVSLDSEPVYYALSYVWGNAQETREILLEGLPFRVTRNLHDAMQQIRQLPGTSLDIGYPEDYFWIDAICINQGDIHEKSQHVPRIMEVYHASLLTIIYLGPDWTSGTIRSLHRRVSISSSKHLTRLVDDKGMKPPADGLMALLFRKASTMYVEWKPLDETDKDDSVLQELFGGFYEDMVQAITELLSRPWFSRVWTIQEACLETNPTVIVGSHSIRLIDLVAFLKFFMRVHRYLYLTPGGIRIGALNQIDSLWHRLFGAKLAGKPLRVEAAEIIGTLLRVTRTKLSTDPRDQLYGLLGIVTHFTKEELPPELMPDYSKPPAQVYWQYASYFFTNLGDLRFLGCSQRHLGADVPSWVPDFRYTQLYGDLKRESVKISADRQVLYLNGIRMGMIVDHLSEHPGMSQHRPSSVLPGFSKRVQTIEQRIIERSATLRKTTTEKTLEGFIRNTNKLFGDGGTESVRHACHRLKKHVEHEKSWLTKKLRRKEVMADAFGREISLAQELSQPYVLLEDGTILCVRRRGVEIHDGDIVCLFKGAHLPSVVRPFNDNFLFLTQCDIVSGTFDQKEFDDDFWDETELEMFPLA